MKIIVIFINLWLNSRFQLLHLITDKKSLNETEKSKLANIFFCYNILCKLLCYWSPADHGLIKKLYELSWYPLHEKVEKEYKLGDEQQADRTLKALKTYTVKSPYPSLEEHVPNSMFYRKWIRTQGLPSFWLMVLYCLIHPWWPQPGSWRCTIWKTYQNLSDSGHQKMLLKSLFIGVAMVRTWLSDFIGKSLTILCV